MCYQFYVYILKCSDDKLHTGFTNNLERRFKEHQFGLNKTAYTYRRRPVELLFSQEFNDVFQAKLFERKFKQPYQCEKLKHALIKRASIPCYCCTRILVITIFFNYDLECFIYTHAVVKRCSC